MKFLFLIASLVFATQSFAEETQDLSKMLADSHCIPVRGADGNISGYNCDGQLGEKMKQGKVQQLGTQKVKKMELRAGDTITSANGEPVDSPAKAMELYNSMKATDKMVVQRPATMDDKFKSCLAGVYTGQLSYHKKSGTFSATPTDFGLNQNGMCKGLEVSVDYANQTEFKVVARANDKIWAVDQTKTIEQVR